MARERGDRGVLHPLNTVLREERSRTNPFNPLHPFNSFLFSCRGQPERQFLPD